MKKVFRILAIVCAVAILLLALLYASYWIVLKTLFNPYVPPERHSFKTEYGDSFQISMLNNDSWHHQGVSYIVKQKKFLRKERIFSTLVIDNQDEYKELETVELTSPISKAYSDGEARIYQFPLYYVYTLDDGKTFHGIKIGEKIEDKEVLRLIDNLQPYG